MRRSARCCTCCVPIASGGFCPGSLLNWRTVHAYFAKCSEPDQDGISVLERVLKKSGGRGPFETGAQRLSSCLDRERAKRERHRYGSIQGLLSQARRSLEDQAPHWGGYARFCAGGQANLGEGGHGADCRAQRTSQVCSHPQALDCAAQFCLYCAHHTHYVCSVLRHARGSFSSPVDSAVPQTMTPAQSTIQVVTASPKKAVP